MTDETKQRALNALATAQNAGGDDFRFPRVFVCGDHVFFTYMAAVRQQLAYEIFEGIKDQPIEKVETPYTEHVNWNENQRGSIEPWEIFPSKEYAQLMSE